MLGGTRRGSQEEIRKLWARGHKRNPPLNNELSQYSSTVLGAILGDGEGGC